MLIAMLNHVAEESSLLPTASKYFLPKQLCFSSLDRDSDVACVAEFTYLWKVHLQTKQYGMFSWNENAKHFNGK